MWALKWIASTLVGMVLGVVSALWMAGQTQITPPISFQDVEVEGWHSDWTIGSEAADLYTRAWVARHGLLALTKREAVYFVRATDDDGQPLKEACDYRVSGGDFPAEWWSITIYDRDSRLPMNDGWALSVDKTDIGDQGDWTVLVSSAAMADGTQFISSKNAGVFDLTLRLYRPSAALIENPASNLVPPSIETVSCGGG